MKAREKEDNKLGKGASETDTPEQSESIHEETSYMNKKFKTREQREALWELYKQVDGKPPRMKEMRIFAEQMGLTSQQIYKWFWDINQRTQNDCKLAMKVAKEAKLLGDEEMKDG